MEPKLKLRHYVLRALHFGCGKFHLLSSIWFHFIGIQVHQHQHSGLWIQFILTILSILWFHVIVIEYQFLKTMGLHVLCLLFIGKKWICNAWLCIQYSENGTDNHRGGQRDAEAVCWEQNVWWVHYDYMCRESERFHVHVKGEWKVQCTCVGTRESEMFNTHV